MNGSVVPTIVHEAEAQRQHIRIPLPVRVEIAGVVVTAMDWSNGGVGLQMPEGINFPAQFKQGNVLDATLMFPFEGFGMTLPVTVEITYADAQSGRIGCRFHNLNRQQQSVIQYFVTAYVSGEVVRVNDIMDVVSRNNFTRARAIPSAMAGLSTAEIARHKMNNMLRVACLSGIALLLVGYVAMSVYERLFVIHATSARVTAELLTVDAPAGGKVHFNPLAPDSMVKQGDALLTVSTMAGNTVSVDSPCDCIVKRRLSDNNRTAKKAEPLLELVRPDAVPFVEAYIRHNQAVKLSVGEEARLAIPGLGKYLHGKITAIQAGRGLKGNSLVIIQPTTPLPVSSVDDPVEIHIDSLGIL
jgi:alginate biosynthesis protein Alg44